MAKGWGTPGMIAGHRRAGAVPIGFARADGTVRSPAHRSNVIAVHD